MPNQFLSDEFGDIEDYFVTDYRLIDDFVGDTLFNWGENNGGQLGINITGITSRNTPVTTFVGGTNWKQISAGRTHMAGIKTDGTLWIWGENSQGRLGINDTTNRSTPVTTFAGGTNWKQVSCGYNHTAAIKTDGSLWTWGRNHYGQLGNNTYGNGGDTTNRSIPVTTFTGGNNWKSVCAGLGDLSTTGAIKTDGTLWVWGHGRQLGVNDPNDRSIPVTTFAGGTNWKQIALSNVTVGIKTDGTLWDTRNDFFTFAQRFSGDNKWKSVSNGGSDFDLLAAIKTDGSLWTWGLNTYGQLGTNDTITKSTPVTTFAGGTNWKSVSVGAVNNTAPHMAAIKTDGTLWTWGSGVAGQLGINDTTTRSAPVTTFAGGNNWKQASAGGVHTSAIKSGLNVDLS